MFTARTVVLIVALGAGGVAASRASGIGDTPSALAGMAATSSVVHATEAVEGNPTIKAEVAATAPTPFARRTTAQK